MSSVVRSLFCLAAAIAAFAAAVFFIVMDGAAENPPAGAVNAGAALVQTHTALVVRLHTTPEGLAVSGVLLREPDRVPMQAEDRVYDLDPTLSNGGDRPLTWRALLAGVQAVHHA
ncbi:hypothetical protein [Enterobacter vonholyi]